MSRCSMCSRHKTSPRNRNDGKCSDCLIICELDWHSLGEYWLEPKAKYVVKKKYYTTYKGKKNYLTARETDKQRVYMRKRQRKNKICLSAVVVMQNCIGRNLTVKVVSR